MKRKHTLLQGNTCCLIEPIIVETLAKEHVRGGYKMRTQPLSDDVKDDKFMDQFCATYTKDIEKYNNMFPSSSKIEQVRHWQHRIENIKAVIQETQSDASISEEAKAAKIKRCMKIIKNDEFSIRSTLEYLQRCADKDKEIWAKLSKRTK